MNLTQLRPFKDLFDKIPESVGNYSKAMDADVQSRRTPSYSLVSPLSFFIRSFYYLARFHPSEPSTRCTRRRAQGGGRRELRRELRAGSEEAAPEEMAPGSSVTSFASGMLPHTPPSLLLSQAPCSPPPCEPPRSASRCAVTHPARSGHMWGREELLPCAGRAV
jgi:hypothetical protein